MHGQQNIKKTEISRFLNLETLCHRLVVDIIQVSHIWHTVSKLCIPNNQNICIHKVKTTVAHGPCRVMYFL